MLLRGSKYTTEPKGWSKIGGDDGGDRFKS